MSVLSRVQLTSQQRFDLSTFLAQESFQAFDLRALVNSLVDTDAFIVRGFEITGSSGLSISIATSDAFVYNPEDTVASFFYGIQGTADTLVNLDPNQSNIYLEATFKTTSQAPQTSAFWNPLAATSSSNASGQEFSSTQDSQVIVQVEITSNIVQFNSNAIPLAIISTNASSITQVIDARPLFFRLGSGGSSPNPFNRFNWSPNRAEPQYDGTAVGNNSGSPYISSDINGITNDKGIVSLKQSLDAIMTRIAEISGSTLWYANSLAQQYVSNLNLNIAYLDSPAGHSIQPNKQAAFRFRKEQLPIIPATQTQWVVGVNSTSVYIYVSSLTNLYVGNQVTISGFNNSQNNGTFTIITNPVGAPSGVITINNPNITNANHNESASATVTGFSYLFDLLGTTPVEWRTNYGDIDWSLGGTYTDLNHRSYLSTNLTVNVPDQSNVYLYLQRETSIASGNPVKWQNNSSYSGFAVGSAISGLAGDFTEIAIGDYVRKVSEGISRYYQVSGFYDGSQAHFDADRIASITAVCLLVSEIIIGTPSSEPIIYWRKRYSAADVFVDPYLVHPYADTNYYWLGRKNGDVFILRDFGLLQANESAFTDDNNFMTVTGGGGDSEAVILEHGFGASFTNSGNYQSTAVNPPFSITEPLLTIRRRRSDNTEQNSYLDNSDSLLQYSIAAGSIIGMTPGQSLYARLSETTSSVLAAGSVVNTANDLTLLDNNSNVYQVLSPADVPLKNFDNRNIFQIARCVTLEDGHNGLIFVDGTVLSFGGSHVNNNIFIGGSAVITNGLNTYKYYYNTSGSTILAGQFVQLTATSTSGLNNVIQASAVSEATCDGLVGVVYQNIPNNSAGLVQISGDATVLTDANLIIGKPAYLSANYGNTSSTIPTTPNQAVYVVGQALATNKIVIGMYFKYLVENVYEENINIVSSITGTNQSLPTSALATFNLPLDSRDSLNQQLYVVGAGTLQVRLNGVWQERGIDWQEVGTVGSLSFQMMMNIATVVGDVLEFRIELEQNETLVGSGGGGGGGGTQSLQSAYSFGSTVNVSTGNPVTITGASGKLLHVAGDVAVDGVVDPTAITFTTQSLNPLSSGQYGLYTNSNGHLIYQSTSSSILNISTSTSGSTSTNSNSDTYTNDSGLTITGISPVSLNTSTGGIKLADPAIESSVFSVIGLILSTTTNGSQGTVYSSGRMPCGIFGFNIGDSLWLNVGGGITNVKPSTGVGGFVTGDFVVQVGIVIKSQTNPSAQDILVRINIVGQCD